MTQSIPCPNPAQCHTKTKTHISHSAAAECAAVAARGEQSSSLASSVPVSVAGRSPAREELESKMEFDTPCVVKADGTVERADGIYAPEYHEDDMMGGEREWEAITGFSGQHGYSGPVMHASEYIGGGLEDYIWDNPGTYVVVEATYDADPEEYPDEYESGEVISGGWVLLRRKEEAEGANSPSSPSWGDDEFDRGPSPQTVGTVIHAVDNFGERGMYRLERFEAENPSYSEQLTGVWVDVNDTSRELRDHEIDQWKPESFPDTKAGDLEREYRNAMHHLSREQRAADADQDAILSEMGLLDRGVRFTAAQENGRARLGINDYTASGEPYGVWVARDDLGVPRVRSEGAVTSPEARQAISCMEKNADKVAAWQDRNAGLNDVRVRSHEVGAQYRDLTGKSL